MLVHVLMKRDWMIGVFADKRDADRHAIDGAYVTSCSLTPSSQPTEPEPMTQEERIKELQNEDV